MASRPRGRGGSSARRRNAGLASVVKDDDSKPVLVADWDCVVVGAGVAGLAAAKNLQAEWPDKKIVVLEARDRVGGRVHTELVDGRLPLDLGAAWLHDLSSDNPLADFVRKSKVVTKISDYDYDAGTHYDMRPDWKEDSDESFEEPEQLPQAAAMPPEKVKQLAAAYEEFKNKLNENRERLFNNEEAEDAPLADLIAESKAQMGIDEGSKLSVWLDEMLYSAFEEVEGADTDELSGLFFDEVDVDVNNGVNLLFPSGAWEMFQPLTEGLDIRLGHEVVSVGYDSRSKVATIATRNGKTFNTSSVVLTVPLGILKARKIEFQPALPKKIQASIGSLGYGTLDKIILLFPPGATSRLLPPDSEILHLHHDSDEERDGFRIVEFFNLDRWTRFLEPRPPYDGLIGFVAGRGAREMEKMTDKELVDIVLGKLRRCDPGLPDPIGHRITRWARDPFSLGSYSFRKPGSHPGDHDAFTQPMAGWLYFAGEHTSDVYPGTMQGAYTTGLRVAGEISAQWLDSSLPASMRAQRHQATSGLPSIGMSGLPMPVSGIPDAMDKVMSGQDFMGGGKDADALLEALAKASPPLPGAGTKDSKKTVTKSKL